MVKQFRREELWKETEINGHKITYLKGHDPHELLELVEDTKLPSNKPIYGSSPSVYKLPYRQNFVAIRTYPSEQFKTLDSELLQAVLDNSAVVETPMASIVSPQGRKFTITKWKYGNNSLNLHAYLEDESIPIEKKKDAICQAA